MGLESFTYDGINSLDYDMYVTQKTVWNAPKRVASMIQVAGRNGDLTIDEGKYENARVRYTLKCNAETKDEFAEKVTLFRNELCSRTGYKRLTDTYNQDEYRMGVFITEFSVNGQFNNTAGVFDVEFNCKPQRFLTAGETERSIPEWSDLHTDSGSLVTIDNSGGEYAVKSLSTDIVPQQDLNGYDNPWAGGAGKNKFPVLSATQTISGVTATKNSDGSITLSGTATATTYFDIDTNFNTTAVAGYYFSGIPSPCPYGNSVRFRISNSTSDRTGLNDYYISTSGVVTGGTITDNGSGKCLSIRVASGTAITTPLKLYPMISAVHDDTFAPYENICPITGFTGANIYVSPTTSVGDATTYNVSFGSAGTVYGGTLDVVTGVLTVTHGIKTISELSWTYSSQYTRFQSSISGILRTAQARTTTMSSSAYVCVDDGRTLNLVPNGAIYAAGTSDNIYITDYRYTDATTFSNEKGSQTIVYPLNTQLTYQLTATQVALLLGTNNIWSNTGDIQIEYGKGGNTLYNPTPFDSLPLIKVTGTGTLGIGDWILTITGLSSQVLYVDCDMMEVYKNTGGIIEGANSLVSINKNTFPKLVPGMNNITKTSGLTNLKITPRWWRI